MKKVFKISHYIIAIGLALWLTETIFYLFSYGWHYGPANDTERLFDTICSWIVFAGFIGFALSFNNVQDALKRSAANYKMTAEVSIEWGIKRLLKAEETIEKQAATIQKISAYNDTLKSLSATWLDKYREVQAGANDGKKLISDLIKKHHELTVQLAAQTEISASYKKAIEAQQAAHRANMSAQAANIKLALKAINTANETTQIVIDRMPGEIVSDGDILIRPDANNITDEDRAELARGFSQCIKSGAPAI